MDTEEFCKACVRLADMLGKATESIAKMTEALRKVFDNLDNSVKTEKVIYKRVRTKRVEPQCYKKYDYIPVTRKNLPYQRRNY